MGVIRRKSDNILPIYLYYQLLNERFNSYLNQSISSLNIINLSRDILYKFVIPLPTMEVQKKIVEEIEGYQKIIDGARQVVDNWKPRIDIDPTWPITNLNSICEVKGGKRIPKGMDFTTETSDYPYIRVTDFNNGSINKKTLKYISKETFEHIKEYTISKDDVYISIAGTIGLVGIVPDELNNKSLTENAAKLVIKDKTIIGQDYLKIILQSDNIQKQIVSATQGVGVPKLGLYKIYELEIPIPSINTQQEIVDKIEAERKIVDGNRELIKIYEAKIKKVIDSLWDR